MPSQETTNKIYTGSIDNHVTKDIILGSGRNMLFSSLLFPLVKLYNLVLLDFNTNQKNETRIKLEKLSKLIDTIKRTCCDVCSYNDVVSLVYKEKIEQICNEVNQVKRVKPLGSTSIDSDAEFGTISEIVPISDSVYYMVVYDSYGVPDKMKIKTANGTVIDNTETNQTGLPGNTNLHITDNNLESPGCFNDICQGTIGFGVLGGNFENESQLVIDNIPACGCVPSGFNYIVKCDQNVNSCGETIEIPDNEIIETQTNRLAISTIIEVSSAEDYVLSIGNATGGKMIMVKDISSTDNPKPILYYTLHTFDNQITFTTESAATLAVIVGGANRVDTGFQKADSEEPFSFYLSCNDECTFGTTNSVLLTLNNLYEDVPYTGEVETVYVNETDSFYIELTWDGTKYTSGNSSLFWGIGVIIELREDNGVYQLVHISPTEVETIFATSESFDTGWTITEDGEELIDLDEDYYSETTIEIGCDTQLETQTVNIDCNSQNELCSTEVEVTKIFEKYYTNTQDVISRVYLDLTTNTGLNSEVNVGSLAVAPGDLSQGYLQIIYDATEQLLPLTGIYANRTQLNPNIEGSYTPSGELESLLPNPTVEIS